jgi:hypothetical protein
MKKPKMKAPEGAKEHLGYFIYKIAIPIASGLLVYAIFKETELEPIISIPVGLFVWYCWARPIFVYLFAPLWNSLYIPCPDLPENSGSATCDVYVSNDSGDKFFKGIAGEFLPYSKGPSIKIGDMRLYLMDNRFRFNIKRLKKIGCSEVDYAFKSHETNTHYMCPTYRNGPIRYKLPVYLYQIKGDISDDTSSTK